MQLGRLIGLGFDHGHETLEVIRICLIEDPPMVAQVSLELIDVLDRPQSGIG